MSLNTGDGIIRSSIGYSPDEHGQRCAVRIQPHQSFTVLAPSDDPTEEGGSPLAGEPNPTRAGSILAGITGLSSMDRPPRPVHLGTPVLIPYLSAQVAKPLEYRTTKGRAAGFSPRGLRTPR